MSEVSSQANARFPSATLPPGFVLDPPPAPQAAPKQGYTTVKAPDGSFIRFPASMSDEEITAVMRRYYGGPGTPPTEKPVTLTPVDHDPFASPQEMNDHKLIPVDHDPFAATSHPSSQLPPGFVLDSPPATFADRFAPTIEHPLQRVPQSAGAPADHPITAGIQGAGRSIADTVGLLPDLADMGANALLAGADFVSRHAGGPAISYRFPLTSDELANTASRAAGSIGVPVLDPGKMTGNERLAYNVNRMGGQAALMLPYLLAKDPRTHAQRRLFVINLDTTNFSDTPKGRANFFNVFHRCSSRGPNILDAPKPRGREC